MKNMTEGSITKNILYFSIPMLLGNFFQQFYNIVDSIVVGRFVGKEALGAVGIAFPVMFLIIALIMGATTGSMILIAQFYGAKKMDALRRMVDTTYIFLFLMSIIATIAGLLLSPYILQILKTPDSIYQGAKTYIDIMFIGMLPLFGYNGLSALMRGVGDSKTPLYLLVIAAILNVFLDILFVAHFRWGIAGASWATVISQGVSFVFGVIILFQKKSILSIRLKMYFDKALFSKSIAIGIPSGVQQMAVALGMMALTRIVNGFGTNAIAAYAAAGRIDAFAMMPAMNFSMALSTFTGQNIGANKIDRVKKGLTSTLFMSTVFCLIITTIIMVFGKNLVSMFNSDPDVISIGNEYLVIVSAFYVVFSIMFIYNGLLRGVGDTFIPMIITIFSLWAIRIPTSAILSGFMGTKGIWFGIPIAWLIGAVFSSIYYYTGRWKTKIAIRNFQTVSIMNEEAIIEEQEPLI
ncbi:MAG: MATE family efflux transporter [Spirochaetes bacterium GWF1_31_7]|nr:MAG: MATE family efflux transporter [Spirochaetes bacterium GWE1_32_154]OHD49163.1 MAG: MATE family efflux transporter [Spirochaetes bacterium GWF1_31_7]OHD50252.1 MAG: MATE family efflux transporter [Spirochaetes bacterium GWE2_31_10]OHD76608.1 MAG: MATE family efflux transporter [Spirochaetes bacterium RIFOXYB1_FULL_32_8]HBD93965.1 MATE family efflux transporter [Spirochaetia bacterium]